MLTSSLVDYSPIMSLKCKRFVTCNTFFKKFVRFFKGRSQKLYLTVCFFFFTIKILLQHMCVVCCYCFLLLKMNWNTTFVRRQKLLDITALRCRYFRCEIGFSDMESRPSILFAINGYLRVRNSLSIPRPNGDI